MVRALPPLHQAIATLRRSLAEGQQGTASATSTVAKAPGNSSAAAASTPSHVASLGLRLRSLSAAAPLSTAVVLRSFIESVLLDELGAEMATSASFQDLVDRTVRALEDEHACRRMIEEALDELLGHRRTRSKGAAKP